MMSKGNGKDKMVLLEPIGCDEVAIGCQEGKVIMMFPHLVRWFSMYEENARVIGEQLAQGAYELHYGIKPKPQVSLLAEGVRRKLHARAKIIVRSMMEQGKSADYIANQVVDQLLKEVT